LDVATFRHTLNDVHPDIVNIHGCNPQVMNQIRACQQVGVPFVISLHGLIGLNPTVKTTPELRRLEGKLLRIAELHQWPIVAISSGVKRRAIDYYELKKPDNIRIILNGTEQNEIEPSTPVNICDEVITSGRKIITCIGSLSKRKNQEQVVDAWAQLPNSIRRQYAVIFFGNDLTRGQITTRINELGLSNEMYVYGFANRAQVNYALERACLNVLASIDEGFGLSVIEALTFGVPSVIFSDIDAAYDLYDECAITLITDRSTVALAKGIQISLAKNWDKDKIIQFAHNFSMDKVCEQYLQLYREITNK
jgi:glycosyltransferase involved in cell wall biosynthesis